MTMIFSAIFKRKSVLTPNQLSFLRGCIGCVLPCLLLSTRPFYYFLAGFLFLFGVLTDYWDGLIARRQQLETHLGRVADPTMDKILILAPLMTFAYMGMFSPWWLVPIVAREIVITFCRFAWIREGKAVGAEKLGKIKFIFQLVSVFVAYLCFLSLKISDLFFLHDLLENLTWIFLFLTASITVVSGLTFAYSNRQLFSSYDFAKFTSALGVGLIPLIPGTWGSAVGVVLVILTHFNLWLYLGTFATLVAIGAWAVGKLDLSQDRDPHFVVMDECCGMFVTLFTVPLTPEALIVGFILFRILDVIKPFPVRQLENLKGYWGILLDDIGAGIYALAILKFLVVRG
jgi:phosphatidylglycerophosphatase A